MARSLPASKSPLMSSTLDDYVFLLRMDEALSSSNFVDALGLYTMTQSGNPDEGPPLLVRDGSIIGSRGFNGSSSFAGRAASTGHHTLLQLSDGGEGWGCAFWARIDASADQSIIEYGEHGGASSGNAQMGIRISAAGEFTFYYQNDALGDVDIVVPDFAFDYFTVYHVGVAVELDPDYVRGFMRLAFYVNGRCIYRIGGLEVPDGGSAARWIIGASRIAGSGVGSPGGFFEGALDDLVVTKWAPDEAWFRHVYARAKRTFSAVASEVNFTTTFTRVLIEPEFGDFAFLDRVDERWVNVGDVGAVTMGDGRRVAGVDMVRQWSIEDSSQSMMQIGSVELMPAFGQYNTSPMVPSRSPVQNHFAEPSTAPGPSVHLIRAMRRIRIEVASVPCGMSKGDADPFYEVVFDGLITDVAPGVDTTLLTVADLGIGLMPIIEGTADGKDRLYGDPAGSDIEVELQSMIDDNDPAFFEIVAVSDTGGTGPVTVIFESTEADEDINGKGKPHPFAAGDSLVIEGTSGFDTPAGSIDVVDSVTYNSARLIRTVGATVSEFTGTVRAVPKKFGYKGGKPKLYTPTSPSWAVYEWNQPPGEPLLQVMSRIVDDGIGYRLAFRWHDVRQCFRLTLWSPRLDFDEVYLPVLLGLQRAGQTFDSMRNVFSVEFPNEDAPLTPTEEKRIYVASDVQRDSLIAFGRQACRVRVGDDTLVSTRSEAADLVATMKQDIGKVATDVECQTGLFIQPMASDGVIIVYEAGEISGVALSPLGITSSGFCESVRHSYAQGRIRTDYRLVNVNEGSVFGDGVTRSRGAHLERTVQPGVVPPRGLTPPNNDGNAPTVSLVAGAEGAQNLRVSWKRPTLDLRARALSEVEVHVSDTADFDADDTTLKAVVAKGSHAIIPADHIEAEVALSSDMLSTSTTQNLPFLGTAVLGGTSTSTPPSAALDGKRTGVVLLRSTTTVNSGYYWRTGLNSVRFGQGRGWTFTGCFYVPTALASKTIRAGFFDTSSVTEPTDGAYIETTGTSFYGRCAKSGSRTSSGTSYTPAADTFYHFKVEVSRDGSPVAVFSIYSDDGGKPGTLLWTDTVTTNLPTTGSMGVGAIATYSAGAAADLLVIDRLAYASKAGKTKYVALVFVDVMGNRSAKTSEASIRV